MPREMIVKIQVDNGPCDIHTESLNVVWTKPKPYRDLIDPGWAEEGSVEIQLREQSVPSLITTPSIIRGVPLTAADLDELIRVLRRARRQAFGVKK